MRRMAFTLIELLVVIAIIAILAAILFPVFAQAKEAAKKTTALSNVKQTGTAFNIYLSDSDDVLPLAMSQRPDGSWRAIVGHPVPAESLPQDATWGSGAGLNSAKCFWANSLQPYMKNYGLFEMPGKRVVQAVAADAATQVNPATMGFTFNGLLHQLNSSTITSPSRVPLMWAGNGDTQTRGRSYVNPALNCGTPNQPCMFNPSGPPQATFAPVATGQTRGSVNFTSWDGNSVWAYGRTSVICHTDSSAKVYRFGATLAPGQDQTVDHDPYNQADAKGAALSLWTCRQNSSQPLSASYWCFFRPDRSELE